MENTVLGLLTVLVAKHAAVEVKKELENVTVQLQLTVEKNALVLQNSLEPVTLKIAQVWIRKHEIIFKTITFDLL